ncbi:MAG: type 4a pilus biogenesis protein PilO [Candidatus Omnitrophica bacterium]|nr:type 4a pilus biogenesis protein PilO [Candidatus Omnitrophota bacterium]
MGGVAGLKKEYLILMALVTAIIVVSYVFFVVAPAWTSFAAFAAQEKKLRQEIAQGEAAGSSRQQISAEIQNIGNRIKFYEKLLPSNTEVSDVINYLTAIGRKNNIAFASLEPLEKSRTDVPNEKKRYIEIPVKLKVRAGYHDFCRFLSEIESADQFMEARDVLIVVNPKDVKNHDISLIVLAFAMERL